MLVVTVVQARGLSGVDGVFSFSGGGKTSDPFVELTCNKQKHKTKGRCG